MEQLKLELDAELARFLNKRAHELRSTPDVLVSSLLTHWLRIAHEKEPLGSDETVQDRMAKIAEHYAAESREILEDDPDLGLDVADPIAERDPDQAWYWTPEWQEGEEQIELDRAAGRFGPVFGSAGEFLDALQARGDGACNPTVNED